MQWTSDKGRWVDKLWWWWWWWWWSLYWYSNPDCVCARMCKDKRSVMQSTIIEKDHSSYSYRRHFAHHRLTSEHLKAMLHRPTYVIQEGIGSVQNHILAHSTSDLPMWRSQFQVGCRVIVSKFRNFAWVWLGRRKNALEFSLASLSPCLLTLSHFVYLEIRRSHDSILVSPLVFPVVPTPLALHPVLDISEY